MKTAVFYIWNTKTDENFDFNENRFYSNSWQPEMTEDKAYLRGIIESDKDKFKDCVIVQKFY